jgi:spore germination cell wall hydrolase CwlJ-like protein
MKWLIPFTVMVYTTLDVPPPQPKPPSKNSDWTIMDRVCLAEAIWRESRGESIEGQKAVAKVVLNRVSSEDYPNTVCRVVFQPFQFSWTQTWRGWRYDQHSLNLAGVVLARKDFLKHFKATHFHSGPPPTWAKDLKIVKKIGNHVFYK